MATILMYIGIYLVYAILGTLLFIVGWMIVVALMCVARDHAQEVDEEPSITSIHYGENRPVLPMEVD